MKSRIVALVAGAVVVLAMLSQSAHAAVRVLRAELSGSQLRVEGDGAVPNARMFIDGIDRGRADDRGQFKLEVSFFSSPTCRISVNDGTGAVEATLSGCTPSRTGPAKPTFGTATTDVVVGDPARFAGGVEAQAGEQVAFTLNWGDGSAITRVPTTGFLTVDANGQASFFAEHSYSQVGSFTLQLTAVDPDGLTTAADPVTVTVRADDQNDCGQAGDAPDELPDTRSVALGVSCAGRLGSFQLDPRDNYHFDLPEGGKLLTFKGIVPDQVINPSGRSECVRLAADATGNCNVTGNRAVGDAVAHTAHQAGRWILQVGQPGSSVPSESNYSYSLHYGGGGDDCVGGRRAVHVSPTDAPNNDGAMVLLERGEVNCVGALPHADADLLDIYGFNVLEEGEIVAVMVEPADGSPCNRRLEVPGVDDQPFLDGRIPEDRCAQMFFEAGVGRAPGPGAFPSFAVQARWPSPQTLSYRIKLATSRSDRHDGDCFTGADATNSFATATPLQDWPVCIGDLTVSDTEDWYRIPARAGDRLGLLLRPAAASPQADLYDPQGRHRASLGDFDNFILDQDGEWRLRITDRAGFPGTYGFRVDFRPGVPGGDCGSGGDTPLTGLAVTFPADCMGSFVLHPSDTNDHYSFHLNQGDVLEVTMQTLQRNPAWGLASNFTASLSSPSTPNVETGWSFSSGGRTFTHTAQETGTYNLNIGATPFIAFDTRYSLKLQAATAPATPDLRASIFIGNDTFSRGNVFQVEGGAFLPSGSSPARNVTLTLSASPSNGVKLTESNFDSFPNGVQPTSTVSLGDIPSPGSKNHTWSMRAEREGSVTLMITARDASGVVATISGTIRINK